MFKRLLVIVVLTFLATACASPQPKTLAQLLEHQAFKLQLQCRAYYFMREPRLLKPDPERICRRVYTLAARGEHVPNWKM